MKLSLSIENLAALFVLALAFCKVNGKEATIRGASSRKLQSTESLSSPGIQLEYRDSYTEPSGGPVIFDDGDVLRQKLEEFPNLQVTKVAIRTGTRVDSVALSYNDGSTIRHGGDGGGLSELILNENEYIVSVVVWIGRPGGLAMTHTFGVYGIRFTTDQGRTFGGGTRPTDRNAQIRAMILTSSPYTMSATKDSVSPALLGFFGRTGSFLRHENEIHRLGGIFSITSCPPSARSTPGVDVDTISNLADNETPVSIENFSSGRRLVLVGKDGSAPSLDAVSSNQVNFDDTTWQLTNTECPSVGSTCGTQCYSISSSNRTNSIYAEYTGDLTNWRRGVEVSDEGQDETNSIFSTWQFVPQRCGDDTGESQCFYIANAYNGRRLFAQADPRTDFGASPNGTYLVPFDDQLWSINAAA